MNTFFYSVIVFLVFDILLQTQAKSLMNSSVIYWEREDDDKLPASNSPQPENAKNEMKLICYYGSWAVYRPGRGKFPVEEIDPFLCSHIIYGFAGLSFDNKIRPLDAYNDLKENWGKGAFQRFTGLKKINKKLKTLIAIGGWNEGSVKYSNMASSSESRKTFVQSVMEFLDRYDFDGLDMDWEYPASRGGRPEDKQNFVLLLKELKKAFEPKNYLLTSAVSAGKYTIDPAYDIPEVSKYLDYINIMCYDYHGGWESKTGHNAPLYARPDEPKGDTILNVNYSINYWISKGAPRNKIILGMGTYGRSFTLSRTEEHGINSPAPQKGQAGPYTREAGSLGYNEICEKNLNGIKSTTVWDPYYMAPYMYWERQWVGFDNIESIKIKSRYAKAMGLAGGMIWSLETDDFQGVCNGQKYPLLNAIKDVFQSSEKPSLPLPNTDLIPTTETTKTSTTTTSTWTPTSTTKTTSRPTWTPASTTKTTSRSTWIPTSTTTRSTWTSISTMMTTKPSTTITTTTTNRPPITTNSPSTTTTTTKNPLTSTTTTNFPPTTSSSSSSTGGWWNNKTTPWWPQKPSSVSASSESWWSSTFSLYPRNHIPNSIEETTPSTTTSKPLESKSNEFHCYDDGLFRNPSVCTKFIRCVETSIGGQFQLFYYECPDKTVFNNVTKLCDWVENVPECMSQVPQYYLRGFTFQNNLGTFPGKSVK